MEANAVEAPETVSATGAGPEKVEAKVSEDAESDAKDTVEVPRKVLDQLLQAAQVIQTANRHKKRAIITAAKTVNQKDRKAARKRAKASRKANRK